MILRTGRRPTVLALALILSVVAVTACAEAEPPAATPTADTTTATSAAPTDSSTETTSSPAPSARTVEVTVTGRTVEPPPATVDLAVGESLTLVVTSDVDNVLHAHGFEVETPVLAGQPTSVTLTGTAPGVFEVELHHPELLLLAVAVR